MRKLANSDRLDKSLVVNGLFRSRDEAQECIINGSVKVNGIVVLKASYPVCPDDEITTDAKSSHYVSRSALKLLAALDHFAISPMSKHTLDVGASTGGFTQVLLERGAESVTAIDVGHDQMRASLRTDPRVTLHEGMNARHITRQSFERQFEFIVMDVSFISATLVLAPLKLVVTEDGDIVILVKPQYEAGQNALDKSGIVKSGEARRSAVNNVSQYAVRLGYSVMGTVECPLHGSGGNIEFLMHLKPTNLESPDEDRK